MLFIGVQAIGDTGCRLFSAGRNLACVVCGCEAGVLKCNGNFIEVVSKCSDNRILLLLGGGESVLYPILIHPLG